MRSFLEISTRQIGQDLTFSAQPEVQSAMWPQGSSAMPAVWVWHTTQRPKLRIVDVDSGDPADLS